MFDWFRPKVPVESAVKEWVDARMGWLVEQFGLDRLVRHPTILPNDDYFPDRFDASENAVRVLFDRVCGYMDLDPARIELHFHYPAARQQFNPVPNAPQPDWAGLYDSRDDKVVIWLDATRLEDPESLVATFAHELSHAHLLGGRRIASDEADLEQLTDLTTVYFGMGIFPANCAFRQKNYHVANWEGWSISTQGYLNPMTWSYALAVYAWLRNESKPEWTNYLQPTVREPCRRAIAYLWKTGDSMVISNRGTGRADPCDLSGRGDLSMNEGTAAPEDSTTHETTWEEESALDNGPEQDPAVRGMLEMEREEWEAAVREFSSAIDAQPDDGELYQHRALAYFELGQSRDSLADAEAAVRLAPEESESYLVRGMVRFQAGLCAQAIVDLSRYLKEEDVSTCNGSRPSKAYYFRGLAYQAQGDLSRALGDLTTAINRWPGWPHPYSARAAVYESLGKPKQAAADREEAARRGG